MNRQAYHWRMPDIEYSVPNGSLPGYLAVPDGVEPRPGVVVVHDALGMTRDLRRITDRLAAHGYLALAPALYRRGSRIGCVVSTLRSMKSGTGPAVDAIVAARTHLAGDARCTGRVGIIGFCMGGGFCLQVAPLGVFDAAAPNYGDLPPKLANLAHSCPVVASYGARDFMLRGAADLLETSLAAGDVPRDVKEYPDVGHSFMNDFGAPRALQFVERIAGLAYSEPEAEDAWRRILAFFEEYLH
jgi:carboxymethylenebutenolidase